MQAYVRTNSDSQNVEFQSVAIPKIDKDEILIRVEAFGVGIHDRYFIPSNVDFPYVIGTEGSGTIVQLGLDVIHFKEGERVIFTTSLQPKGGSWGEYAVAKSSTLIPLPKIMTFEQGAAIPIAGKTAMECIRELNLNKNETLFIAGASGAIGT